MSIHFSPCKARREDAGVLQRADEVVVVVDEVGEVEQGKAAATS